MSWAVILAESMCVDKDDYVLEEMAYLAQNIQYGGEKVLYILPPKGNRRIDNDVLDVFNGRWTSGIGSKECEEIRNILLVGIPTPLESGILINILQIGKLENVYAVMNNDYCVWKAGRFRNNGGPICNRHLNVGFPGSKFCAFHNTNLYDLCLHYWENKHRYHIINVNGATTSGTYVVNFGETNHE